MRNTPNSIVEPLSQSFRGERIAPLVLVVEDHQDTRELYNFVLTAHHYQVVEVDDGEIAVGLVEQLSPDVILMGTHLPTLDGLGAAERIRASGRKDVPIIFISGNADPALKLAALNAGGDDYLLKPISLVDLEAAVARSLGRSEGSQSRARKISQ